MIPQQSGHRTVGDQLGLYLKAVGDFLQADSKLQRV